MGDRLGTRSVLRFLLEAILAKRVIFKVEDVHVRGLPSYLLQRGVGIAVIDSDESCLPVIRKLARACPVVWRPEG